MDPDKIKPYANIAEQIKWHRKLLGLTKKQYAQTLDSKRSALNNWESGDFRISIDAAMSLHRVHGLSLDFIFQVLTRPLARRFEKSGESINHRETEAAKPKPLRTQPILL